jgi:hypothetical protein
MYLLHFGNNTLQPLAFLLVGCYDRTTMTHAVIPIDISHNPDLLRLAEEVAATKTPRKLTRDNKTVAILMPVGSAVTPKKMREKAADYTAFRAAFGSWKDVDTDTLLKNTYEDRRRTNSRPPVKL